MEGGKNFMSFDDSENVYNTKTNVPTYQGLISAINKVFEKI